MTMSSRSPHSWSTPALAWSLFLGVGLVVQRVWGAYVTGAIVVAFGVVVFGGILLRNWCPQVPDDPAQQQTREQISEIEHQDRKDTTTGNADEGGVDDDNDDGEGQDDLENLIAEDDVLNSHQRLYYLDNIKSFLTVLVVSHHITSSFGSYGEGWVISVGNYGNLFQVFGKIFLTLNQGYFMPLFFFIAAYFVPFSYDRKGHRLFLLDKTKRYWLPTFFVTFVQFPLVIMLAQWTANQPIRYYATPGHCWFLQWLLMFCLVYAQTEASTAASDEADNDDGESYQIVDDHSAEDTGNEPFPKTRTRWVYGTLLCGAGMLLVLMICYSASAFGTMPISIGSLVNDIFMFWVGVHANRRGWLEQNLREQLDLSPLCLRLCVVAEAAAMVVLLWLAESQPLYGVPAVILSGQYCLDMSLAMLEWFQTNLNFKTRWSVFASQAAYTVYIIHPVIVTACSSLWIKSYTLLGYELGFGDNTKSSSHIAGGSVTLFVSWVVVNLICHAILWPLSWYLRKLPGLRQIL